jgi:DNA-binding response OmpR family regulator
MASEKSTILIVEDDLDVADMLNAYFRVQGYEVLTENFGEQAIRICEQKPPDLIILDIRLPDIDGFEVASHLREQRRTSDIPIIFLTKQDSREDRLRGLAIGGDDYIVKPFDIQELRLRVRNSLARAKQSAHKNLITNLPEGRLVDEQLRLMLRRDQWAVMMVSLENLDVFREEYGFIAADDVMRAVSMMVFNTVNHLAGPDEFIGHLAPEKLVVVTSPEVASKLKQRVIHRLKQSLHYFYPMRDREADTGRLKSSDLKQLQIWGKDLNSSAYSFYDINELKNQLLENPT